MSCIHNLISGSVLEVTVRPEANCKTSNGRYIERLLSCEQVSLAVKLNSDSWKQSTVVTALFLLHLETAKAGGKKKYNYMTI